MLFDLTKGIRLNLRFLGDALDHWKGSIFERLRDGGIVQNFAVDAAKADAVLTCPPSPPSAEAQPDVHALKPTVTGRLLA